MISSFRRVVADVRRHKDLYFAVLLPKDRILKAFGDASVFWSGWVYTPAVTVWAFLSQCLSQDHSCREAVARVIGWRVANGLEPCSAATGAYCTARADLPEEACRELALETGKEVEQQAPSDWLWHGRRVRVVDGSTITMPDTPANQAAFPQLSEQEEGCGLPIARIVVVFSLAVGTVLDAAIGKYKGKLTGENSMFRRLHENALSEGDIVLADRYFSGWFDIALLQERGVDVLVRKHQLRATDFRTGTRLGPRDHLVRWKKSPRAKWMSQEDYDALPESLTLREMRVEVKQKGFRTKHLIIVTTLLDAERYSAEEVGQLFRQRWQAELNLRSVKIVLQMDHLRCKTPERVRNEFWMHLLGYNLIRKVMAMAAQDSGAFPWQVSFKGTLQTVHSFLPLLTAPIVPNDWVAALLHAVSAHVVGGRPDRYEPRRVKRRHKSYKYFRKPREAYRRQMAQGG